MMHKVDFGKEIIRGGKENVVTLPFSIVSLPPLTINLETVKSQKFLTSRNFKSLSLRRKNDMTLIDGSWFCEGKDRLKQFSESYSRSST